MIQDSKYFIYIENQFFISYYAGQNQQFQIFNTIGETIINRIKRAIEEGQKYRVIVVLPLLPGFEGSIGEGNDKLLKNQLYYQNNSIRHIYIQLKEFIKQRNPSLNDDELFEQTRQYVVFFGLRNHGILNKQLVTEIIYVHSKMIIIDDRIAVIGSANINDRSLMGDRDSELAIVLEDN